MRKAIILSMSLAIILLIISSGSVVFADTDAQIRKIAEPMMDNILKAMKNRDYKLYTKNFDPTMKKVVTKGKFLSACDSIKSNFGDYKSRKYFTIGRKGGMVKIIWKAKYSKTKRNVQMELVLKKYGDKWLIAGHWFR